MDTDPRNPTSSVLCILFVAAQPRILLLFLCMVRLIFVVYWHRMCGLALVMLELAIHHGRQWPLDASKTLQAVECNGLWVNSLLQLSQFSSSSVHRVVSYYSISIALPTQQKLQSTLIYIGLLSAKHSQFSSSKPDMFPIICIRSQLISDLGLKGEEQGTYLSAQYKETCGHK